VSLIGVGAIALSAWVNLPKRIVWNATASTPIGLYWITPGTFTKGDLVLTRLDSGMKNLIIGRGYLPFDVPILKRIAASDDDEICRLGAEISINGAPVATALSKDTGGRSLPVWSGCRVLKTHEILLLNDHPRSLDGRYFGATNDALVIGRAQLLWARP
jgi:conjugative transfer signal peptidase TraF